MKVFKAIFYLILFVIATAAIFVAITYWKKNPEKKDLTDADRKGTGGQYISLSAGVTHYQLSGPDTGKVVVLIHGFSVPYYIWDGTYEYLAAQGFRVLRYDEYGRGYSDRPDVTYNKDLYLTQLRDLINALHIETPVDIMGISFGGAVTTSFTSKYPDLVDKVVLIDPVYPFAKPTDPQLYTRYHDAIHSEDRANGQLGDFKYPARHPGWVERYKVQMQYKGFTNALISTRYNYDYNGRRDNTSLNATGKKVLLIWGKEDHTVPFVYSDSVLSVLKAEFFPVDDSGHLPYIEQADKVNGQIAEFLKKKD